MFSKKRLLEGNRPELSLKRELRTTKVEEGLGRGGENERACTKT